MCDFSVLFKNCIYLFINCTFSHVVVYSLKCYTLYQFSKINIYLRHCMVCHPEFIPYVFYFLCFMSLISRTVSICLYFDVLSQLWWLFHVLFASWSMAGVFLLRLRCNIVLELRVLSHSGTYWQVTHCFQDHF